MSGDPYYWATLFVIDESGGNDGNDGRPFLHSDPFTAVTVEEAKKHAKRWGAEVKPAYYAAVELWLRQGETKVWTAIIRRLD